MNWEDELHFIIQTTFLWSHKPRRLWGKRRSAWRDDTSQTPCRWWGIPQKQINYTMKIILCSCKHLYTGVYLTLWIWIGTFFTDMAGSCGNDTCVDTFMLAMRHVYESLRKDKTINCEKQQLNWFLESIIALSEYRFLLLIYLSGIVDVDTIISMHNSTFSFNDSL